jgi:non-homologous end joining protein Ku
MIHVRHRLSTTEEIATLKRHCITHGDSPWNPSSFSDQVADKFYQQVIDTKNYNASSKNQNIIRMPILMRLTIMIQSCPFYDPSDLLENNQT